MDLHMSDGDVSEGAMSEAGAPMQSSEHDAMQDDRTLNNFGESKEIFQGVMQSARTYLKAQQAVEGAQAVERAAKQAHRDAQDALAVAYSALDAASRRVNRKLINGADVVRAERRWRQIVHRAVTDLEVDRLECDSEDSEEGRGDAVSDGSGSSDGGESITAPSLAQDMEHGGLASDEAGDSDDSSSSEELSLEDLLPVVRAHSQASPARLALPLAPAVKHASRAHAVAGQDGKVFSLLDGGGGRVPLPGSRPPSSDYEGDSRAHKRAGTSVGPSKPRPGTFAARMHERSRR